MSQQSTSSFVRHGSPHVAMRGSRKPASSCVPQKAMCCDVVVASIMSREANASHNTILSPLVQSSTQAENATYFGNSSSSIWAQRIVTVHQKAFLYRTPNGVVFSFLFLSQSTRKQASVKMYCQGLGHDCYNTSAMAISDPRQLTFLTQ